jgi:hypothetical protein
VLTAHINTMPYASLSALLPGRSVDAVKQRATMLGLDRLGARFSTIARNEAFFDDGGLTAAYWAGFIAADGCVVTSPRMEVRIGLNARDACHLRRFVSDSSYQGQVSLRGDLVSLTVCAAGRWIRALESVYRIGPRKSQTLMPPCLSDAEALAYSVGYIDGDGCWHRDKANGRLHLIVVGTSELLDWLNASWLKAGASVGSTKSSRVRGIYRRSWSGSHAESIARLLGRLRVPFMKRKWSIAMKGVKGTP